MKNSLLLLLACFLSLSVNAQWQRQYPLDKLEQVLDIALHGDKHGFAVGSNDLILKLDHITKKWDLLKTWNKKWKLEAVDYIPFEVPEFVVAGGQGLIMSENGGFNWSEIPGAPTGIHAVLILSKTDILVSSDGGVFRWKDKSWIDLSPVTSGIEGAFMLDDQHLWVFTNGATPVLYYSTNGGQSWDQNTDIERPDVVRFYDDQYGVASDGRKIYKTLNGGQNWTLTSTNAISNTSADIAFGESPNLLISATVNANPAISQDSGLTWTNFPMGFVSGRSYSVGVTSDDDFFIGNDLSSIGHTANGGNTWNETSGPLRNVIQDVHFLNRNVGFAVGLKGQILRTTNDGLEWIELSNGDTRNYLSIHGLTPNDMWIGGNQRVLHSADMGVTWQEKGVFAGGNMNDILEVTTNVILVASSSGHILRTADAGASWDTVFTTTGQMKSIARLSAQRFVATGFNGIIVRSEDQGVTWNSITIPEPALQYEQSYFIGDEGWLVTSSFKKSMWHTTNGGTTWDTITLPIDRFWDGVYFITPDTGIIVGHSSSEGRAYITFNGGANWQSGYVLPFALTGVTGIPNPNGTAWIFGSGSDIEVLPYCNTLPVIADFQGDLFPCEGDTVQYTITSQDVDLYNWFLPAGWSINGNASNDTVDVVVGKNSGTLSVVGLNSCGFSGQLSFSTGVDLKPEVGGVVSGFSCAGHPVFVDAFGTNIDTYHWILPSGWQFIGDSTSESIQVLPVGNGGEIQVYGENQCGFSEAKSVIVVIFEFPAFDFEVNSTTLSVAVIGQFQYQWFLNGSLIPGATSAEYIITQSGEYTLLLTDELGCGGFSNPQFVILTSVETTRSKDLIMISPSPAQDKIFLGQIDAGAQFSIVDLNGAILMKGFYDHFIDITSLSAGAYQIVVMSGTITKAGRFVVVR